MEPEDGQEPQTERLVYANWVRIGISPFEMAVDLGYRPDPAPPETFPFRAVMSWEHAVELRDLINDAIETYEKEIGPIRVMEGEIGPARLAGHLVPSEQTEEQ